MPSEYTYPFEAPLQPGGCDDVQLRAAIRVLESELRCHPDYTDAHGRFDWEEWNKAQRKVWLLLKSQQELCKRRGQEFARVIFVPHLPSSSGVQLDVGSNLRVNYNVAGHVSEPWPVSPGPIGPKKASRAWLEFHDFQFFRVASRTIVSDSSMGRVNGYDHLWQNFGVIRAEGEAVDSLFLERVGERWGREMAHGFGFLFEIENSRMAGGFHFSQAKNLRHWRLDLLHQMIEVVAGEVEIPNQDDLNKSFQG